MQFSLWASEGHDLQRVRRAACDCDAAEKSERRSNRGGVQATEPRKEQGNCEYDQGLRPQRCNVTAAAQVGCPCDNGYAAMVRQGLESLVTGYHQRRRGLLGLGCRQARDTLRLYTDIPFDG